MIKTRMYEQRDYERIIAFLREMYERNRNQHCWLSTRWEYAEHLVNPLFVERGYKDWEERIKIWEEDGSIIGIVHPEDTYNAFLQINPKYRFLEAEMIDWAEKNIAMPVQDGSKKIVIWVNESDHYRQQLLQKRGYIKGKECNFLNVRKIDNIITIPIAEGYTICSMEEGVDMIRRYNVTNQAFNPAASYQFELPGSFKKMIKAPMYRMDLDIIALREDDSVAAACTIWYDERHQFGMIEPVGTHPEHQRKGLGKAVVVKGLNRLKLIGAQYAYVESFGENRYSFYRSIGFEAYDQDYPWTRVIKETGE
jgi:mycothiol synthase